MLKLLLEHHDDNEQPVAPGTADVVAAAHLLPAQRFHDADDLAEQHRLELEGE